MLGVCGGTDSSTKQLYQHHDRESQSPTFSFCIHFDAAPPDVGGPVCRDPQQFKSLTKELVPLHVSLSSVTLSELISRFMARIVRQHPHLWHRTVDSIFVGAVCFPSPNKVLKSTTQMKFCEWNVSTYANKTLDKLFSPFLTDNATQMDLFVHWCPLPQSVVASRCTGRPPQRGQNDDGDMEKQSDTKKEDEKSSILIHALEEIQPLPITYPFTLRCVGTMPLPLVSTPKGCTVFTTIHNDSSDVDLTFPPLGKNAMQEARSALIAEEKNARAIVAEVERIERNTIEETEKDELRQTIAVLHLMDDYGNMADSLCIPKSSIFPYRRYPVHIDNLKPFPFAVDGEKLGKQVDETVRLSRLFSKVPYGRASQHVVNQKMEKNVALPLLQEHHIITNDGQDPSETEKLYAAVEELVEHYADTRRDLLYCERTTFRSLITEMQTVLAKQKHLEDKPFQNSILEEMERVSVLDFQSYAFHYEQSHVFVDHNAITKNHLEICSISEEQGEKHTDETLSPRMRLSTSSSYKQSEMMRESELATDAKEITTALPSLHTSTKWPSPSFMRFPNNFRQAMEERRKCAETALETIARIDMRWSEPTFMKIEKQRFFFAEEKERTTVMDEEGLCRDRIVKYAKHERYVTESRELEKYCRLIEPIIKDEERSRIELEVEERRVIVMLLFLHHRLQQDILQVAYVRSLH